MTETSRFSTPHGSFECLFWTACVHLPVFEDLLQGFLLVLPVFIQDIGCFIIIKAEFVTEQGIFPIWKLSRNLIYLRKCQFPSKQIIDAKWKETKLSEYFEKQTINGS